MAEKRKSQPRLWLHEEEAQVSSKERKIQPRGRILVRNPDKSLKSFPPCYSQSPQQLCLLFLFFKLTQPLPVSVKEKGGKPDRKPYPHSYGLRHPYRNLRSENSQDYAQKPQSDCTFMNSASVFGRRKLCMRPGLRIRKEIYYLLCTPAYETTHIFWRKQLFCFDKSAHFFLNNPCQHYTDKYLN